VPEYLAPGVYVEETSFRPKTIEGVSTSTAAFAGPTRFGPTEGEPDLLTSFGDFSRVYGGLEPLGFSGGEQVNYLAHGVRAFFEEGGRRCYVARVFSAGASANGGRATVSAGATSGTSTVTLEARFPGRAGNLRVTFTARPSDNILALDPITNTPVLRSVREGDTVYRTQSTDPPTTQGYYTVFRASGGDLRLRADDGTEIDPATLDTNAEQLHHVTASVLVERPVEQPLQPGEAYETLDFLEGFALEPTDARSLAGYFLANPPTRARAATVPFTFAIGFADPAETATGIDVAQALFGDAPFSGTPQNGIVRELLLTGGSDGDQPGSSAYAGQVDAATQQKSGLLALEDVEDASMVAAPGYSAGYASDAARAEAIQAQLIGHAERMRYRIAILDAPDGAGVGDVRAFRSKVDSKYAALYYPWVVVVDPTTGQERSLPPSGFMAGIYARNDAERGVHKAPANEVVRLAIRFEFPINAAQQDALNPEGINCLRFFEGRGHRVWGARVVTSDGEWKYVNLRRYFAYLERSIDLGTQVFVFEPNGDKLWGNVRRTVEDFLYNEWKSGRLMGLKAEEAYFVKCDRSTMTQNDIDNGRLICLVGVAPLRPAEFVIFRIGQKLLETR
jgi:phage tail sheath protein FI